MQIIGFIVVARQNLIKIVAIGIYGMLGTNSDNIISFLHRIVNGNLKKDSIPDLCVSKSYERIVKVMSNL